MDADERRRRIEAIRAYVREHDVSRWIDLQLASSIASRFLPGWIATVGELSHVSEAGDVRMVDVGGKPTFAPPRGRAGDGADGGRDGDAVARPAER